jgi:hypothetical protein
VKIKELKVALKLTRLYYLLTDIDLIGSPFSPYNKDITIVATIA